MLGTAVGPLHHHRDVVGAFPVVDHLVTAAHVHAEVGDPRLQDLLDAVLGHSADAEVVVLQGGEVDAHTTEVALVADLDVTETGQQPPLVEDLGGAPGEADPARLAARSGSLLVDNDVDAVQPELALPASTRQVRHRQ